MKNLQQQIVSHQFQCKTLQDDIQAADHCEAQHPPELPFPDWKPAVIQSTPIPSSGRAKLK